jgi:hypothetical protein
LKNKRYNNQEKCSPLEIEALRRDLESPDDAARAKAARSVCPCRLGWTAFEQSIETLSKLQKDANPDVRAAALHVFEDAAELESDGLPTHRREGTSEMLRVKRASRFRKDEDDLAALRRNKRKGKM